MKSFWTLCAAVMLFTAVTPPAAAQNSVPLDFFYDNLDPYGSWQEVGNYGYCWQPYDVAAGWRPYSDGRWVYTDAGWTWDSNEPYSWAVYHYGRWANVNGIGWIWVPGTEWGPGWVSWRHSSQYIGWAPLPPEALFLRAIGLSGWVDDYYNIGPNNYRFVENRNFGAQRLNSVFIDQRQNVQIIHQTTNITNITYVNNTVYNGGLGYDQQSRQSTIPIQRYKLDRRQSFQGDPRHQSADHLRSRVNGDSLSMLALPFSGHSSTPPPRVSKKVDRAEVNHGWNNAGTPAEVTALRERLKSKARVPDQLPTQPRFERPMAPKQPRIEERAPQTKEQPPKAKPNREATPPMQHEKKVQAPDRPPEMKRAPFSGSARPPHTENTPPQQRIQPKPPEMAPKRPEVVRPAPTPRPVAPSAPPQTRQRPEPAARPAPSAPAQGRGGPPRQEHKKPGEKNP